MSKGEDTRQRIIVEAAPVFNQHGFAGTTLQDLMSATGLEKGGIYRHFPTKEALAQEVFRYSMAQNVKLRTEHLDEIPTALAKLKAAIDHFVTRPSAIPGGCPILNTAAEADDTNEVLRALALDAVRAWRGRLEVIVESGRKAREFRKSADPRQVANTIMATLEGAQMIARLEHSKQPLLDAQTSLNALLDTLAR